MTDSEVDNAARSTRWVETLVGGGLAAIFHLAMILVVATGLALVVFDVPTIAHCARLIRAGDFAPSAWRLVGHVALAALLWGGCVGAFRLWRHRSRREQRTIEPARGSVMLETLIVMLPFLLLTSGLAQLAINNVASVLAEYAAFQGARTAWLWEPEIGERRQPSNDTVNRQYVRRRARLAVAGAMAPSAPGDFRIQAPFIPDELRNYRGTMAATFSEGIQKMGTVGRGEATAALQKSRGAGSEARAFAKALDSDPLGDRAPRKLTFSYMAARNIRLLTGQEVGVRFQYRLQQVFPWFAYIHGDYGIIAGRQGYFVTLRRESTIRRQAQF